MNSPPPLPVGAAGTARDDGTVEDDASDRPEAAISRMGRRINAARAGRMSVKQLATASGVSAGLISEIERGLGNPSFRTIHSIARALGLQIGDLIDTTPDAPVVGLVRRAERKRLEIGAHGPVWELLSPSVRGELEVLETTLPAGFSNESSPFRHEGEECVVVQRGSVIICVGDVRHQLHEGDAVTYDADQPHWYHNPGDEPAVVLGAVTPASF